MRAKVNGTELFFDTVGSGSSSDWGQNGRNARLLRAAWRPAN